jgi:eukaryotic-like serine/threonine-protein kinase
MTHPSGHDILGVQPGEVLAGKYRVERILGLGGMGVVVAAHHLHLDEKVALKFLLPDALQIPEVVGRFSREAKAAAKIKSEHVARVIDVGQLDNGSPYMVMEYLEGRDLSDWLKTAGPMAVEQAVDFILQASEAIAEAHSVGIVHRDLKPANLFCIKRADGLLCVKLLDFGISKTTDVNGDSTTVMQTTSLVGSPQYMSPEQLQASTSVVDTRTDIWSLGILLFELVSQRFPFEGDSVTDLAIKIVMKEPIPLEAFRPSTPPGFSQVLRQCIEKDPNRRFQNIGELARALQPYGSRRAAASADRIVGTLEVAGIFVSSVPPPPTTAPVFPPTTRLRVPTNLGPSTSNPPSFFSTMNPRVLALGIVIGLTAFAGGGLLAMEMGRGKHVGAIPLVAPSAVEIVAPSSSASARSPTLR